MNPPTTTPDLERAQQLFEHAARCSGPAFAAFTTGSGAMKLRCRGCERQVPVARLLENTDEDPHLTRYRLTCIWCGQTMRLSSPMPRQPLHTSCALDRRRVRGEAA
ncbi:hypothetical protein [Nocardioides sp. J54]|uniref:hypothetical protein n=1 Tax=Nocardioides sp. J54 TaxID=935866 RepID=UPI000491F04B|nr:hypothetical protein [Nocardioides sp. J54]